MQEEKPIYFLTEYPFPFYVISVMNQPEDYPDDKHLILDNGDQFYEKLLKGNKTIRKELLPKQLLEFIPENQRNNQKIQLPKHYHIEDYFLEGATTWPIVDIPRLENILGEMDAKPNSFVTMNDAVFIAQTDYAGMDGEWVTRITTYENFVNWAKELRKIGENTFYPGINTMGGLSREGHSGISGYGINHDVYIIIPQGQVINIGG